MKRRMRLLFATVTGAAVLSSTFVASSAASAQVTAVNCALNAATVTKIDVADAYVPVKDDNKATFSIGIAEPFGPPSDGKYPVVTTSAADAATKTYAVKSTITSVTVKVLKTGGTEGPAATVDTTVPFADHVVPAADVKDVGLETQHTKIAPPASAEVKGSFVVKEADKDKVGNWKLLVTVTRAGGSGQESCKEFEVSGKQEVASGSVSPSTIQLKRGQDVPVRITASVKNASGVSAELRPHDGSMWINVPLTKEGDGNYRYTAYLADDTSPGSWYLVIKGTRGKEAIEATGMSFTILAPEDGVAPKASSKVTIKAPKKAKLGKAFKIYGKAYRGSKGYSGKVLELYFKKKGKKSFTFYGFAKATSTGVWAKNVKQKYDGYWRVVVPGTSKTKKSYANSSLVDVK